MVKILVDAGISDITTLAAAALHDTLEDTSTTFEELVSVFGVAVATVVQECSDDKKLPKVFNLIFNNFKKTFHKKKRMNAKKCKSKKHFTLATKQNSSRWLTN